MKLLSSLKDKMKENPKGVLTSHEVKLDRAFWLRAALAFLLGRTVLADGLSPFAPAVFAGCRPLGGLASMSCGIAALLGSATLGRLDVTGYHALALLQLAFLLRAPRDHASSSLVDSFLCGGVVAVSRGASIVALTGSPTMYNFLSALLEGLCAVVVSLLIHTAFASAKVSHAEERRAEALLVMVLLSLGGLHGVSLWGVGLETVAVMGAGLIVSYAGGPGAGAIAGLSGGLVLSLAGGHEPLVFGLLGVSGLLAGVGGWFGRTEAVLGYLASGLLLSLYAAHPDEVTLRFVEQVIACIPLMFVTPRVLRRLTQVFPGLFPPMPVGRRAERGGERLFERPAKAEIEPLKLKAAAVAHALNEISAIFTQAAAASQALASDRPRADKGGSEGEASAPIVDPAVVRQVAERVCRECDGQEVCWEQRFGDTFEAFSDLMRRMAVTGRLTSADGDNPLSDQCVRFGEVVGEINHWKELNRLEKRVRALDDETKVCLAFQYRCLSQLLLSGKAREDKTSRSKRPRLKVTYRGGTIPAEGASKPGDLWTQYDMGSGKTLLVLADGMGKGDAAARQAKDTLDLMKSLLDCGLDYDSCVSFLNSALFLACRPESFIAIDCLLIDQESERAYFHKFGSPPSFIRKRDGNVVVVRGSRPPAGALNEVPCYSSSEPISPGDVVFLVSDGVFRSSPVPARAEHLIVSRIRRLKDTNLEVSVKALLGQGPRGDRRPPDDVTVVGIAIEGA